ncbi:MAG: TolC family protein [Spirochaetota bacterium]|nr:TolC family protein [Spirochaetota bacterium]
MRNKLIILTLSILIIFLISGILLAETVSLNRSITISLENNNNYKRAFESANESSQKVKEVWGMLWPTLSTDATYTRLGAEAGMSSSIDAQYDIKFINGNITVNPGIFYNSLKASRSAHVIAVSDLRKVKSETTIQTISLYYGVMLARESVKMRKESLEALKENLKTVTTGYEKGILSRLDFLRAKVAFSNAKTMLINSENDYLTALSGLNIHLGYEIDYPLKISSGSTTVSDKMLTPIGSKASRKGDFVNNMIGEALKNRPELIQIRKKREAEVFSAKAQESFYMWPTFFIDGSYGQSKSVSSGSSESTGDPQMDAIMSGLQENFTPSGWNREWAITFGASYRWGALSPLDPSHAKSKQNRSKAKQTEFQLKDFIKAVKLEVKRGYLKLKSAQNSLNAQKGNIETAEETLKVSIVQFKNGIIDNTRLLEANVQLTTARTLFIQSLFNYQVAKAELNKAIGQDYFTIE